MTTYYESISYGGQTIEVFVYPYTGTIEVPGPNGFTGSENTHSIRVKFAAEDVSTPGLLRPLTPELNRMISEAKDYIDGITDSALNAELIDAGLVELPELPVPANFTANAVSDTQITLTWDAVTDADTYTIESANNPDFSPSAGVNAAVIASPSNYYSLASGTTYYFRIKAVAAGFSDSDWVTVNATTAP